MQLQLILSQACNQGVLGLREFLELQQKTGESIHIVSGSNSSCCGDQKGGGEGGQAGFILFLYCMDLIL